MKKLIKIILKWPLFKLCFIVKMNHLTRFYQIWYHNTKTKFNVFQWNNFPKLNHYLRVWPQLWSASWARFSLALQWIWWDLWQHLEEWEEPATSRPCTPPTGRRTGITSAQVMPAWMPKNWIIRSVFERLNDTVKLPFYNETELSSYILANLSKTCGSKVQWPPAQNILVHAQSVVFKNLN